MSKQPPTLRERLEALKPHSSDQLPLGQLLSFAELDAILSAVYEATRGVIGEDETHWTDHWGEEHNSLTDNMTSRNGLRKEQRLALEQLLATPTSRSIGGQNGDSK